MIEHRYEETAGEYFLRSWTSKGEHSERGLLETRPDWLVSAVEVARVGGYIDHVPCPPPDYILWFYTDEKGNMAGPVDFNAPRHMSAIYTQLELDFQGGNHGNTC